MRELTEQCDRTSRRATWMEPAHAPLGSGANMAHGMDSAAPTLGEQAVRLTRVAVAMHMDQAAKLRAMMAARHALTRSCSPAVQNAEPSS